MRTQKLWALAPAIVVAASAHAGTVSYLYTGTVATNSPFTQFRGTPVEALITLDLDVTAAQTEADRKLYSGAVVGGYFTVDGIEFPLNPGGSRNTVSVRTGVLDVNTGTRFNQFFVNISTDGVDRAPFSFPGAVSLTLFDFDDPADTVVDLGMDQPLDTLKTQSHGGVDRISIGMGVAIGSTFSTITSGDGGMLVVPAPGSVALLVGAGLVSVRRRR